MKFLDKRKLLVDRSPFYSSEGEGGGENLFALAPNDGGSQGSGSETDGGGDEGNESEAGNSVVVTLASNDEGSQRSGSETNGGGDQESGPEGNRDVIIASAADPVPAIYQHYGAFGSNENFRPSQGQWVCDKHTCWPPPPAPPPKQRQQQPQPPQPQQQPTNIEEQSSESNPSPKKEDHPNHRNTLNDPTNPNTDTISQPAAPDAIDHPTNPTRVLVNPKIPAIPSAEEVNQVPKETDDTLNMGSDRSKSPGIPPGDNTREMPWDHHFNEVLPPPDVGPVVPAQTQDYRNVPSQVDPSPLPKRP